MTDDSVLARPDFLRRAARVLEAGGTQVALHVRGPGTGGRTLFGLVERLIPGEGDPDRWIAVNDRVDVALACGVRRVHLGGRSLPPRRARAVLGAGSRIGVSVHRPLEAREAVREGADWIFMGTIHPTPSHPGREGLGPTAVAEAVQAATGIPVVAIGGITPGRVGELTAHGAHGVAVVRGVWDAPDPVTALNEYLEALAATAGGNGQDA